MSLRRLAEQDLGTTLEGTDFGMSVVLVDPDGNRQEPKGQVLYSAHRINQETGEKVVVDMVVVTLRRSSLTRVPQAGENWLIEYPESVLEGAPMVQAVLSPTRPPEGGQSIGMIRLYPQEVEQSEAEA